MEGKNQNEIIFWHAFNSIDGFGPQTFKKLLAGFKQLEEAWKSTNVDKLQQLGLSKKQIDNFFRFRQKHSPDILFEELAKENI